MKMIRKVWRSVVRRFKLVGRQDSAMTSIDKEMYDLFLSFLDGKRDMIFIGLRTVLFVPNDHYWER